MRDAKNVVSWVDGSDAFVFDGHPGGVSCVTCPGWLSLSPGDTVRIDWSTGTIVEKYLVPGSRRDVFPAG